MEDVIPLVSCVLAFALVLAALFAFSQGYALLTSRIVAHDSAVVRCLYISSGMDTGNVTTEVTASMPTYDGVVTCNG